VQFQFYPNGGAGRFLGQVVFGGAKSARGDDAISMGKGRFQCQFEALRIIPHHALVIDVHAHPRQIFGNVGGVGVDHVPQ